MTLEQELRLSYYMEIAGIDTEHGVSLVQDVRSKDFFVKKELTVYNADIYRYLQQHPIANTPAILLAEEDEQGLTVIEEYIPGNTLEEILEQRGPLTEAEVIEITRQLGFSPLHPCDYQPRYKTLEYQAEPGWDCEAIGSECRQMEPQSNGKGHGAVGHRRVCSPRAVWLWPFQCFNGYLLCGCFDECDADRGTAEPAPF